MLLPIVAFQIKELDMVERTHLRMELNVACGIALAHYGGVEAGAKFMLERGVPLDVAKRTLLHPQMRRSTDCK